MSQKGVGSETLRRLSLRRLRSEIDVILRQKWLGARKSYERAPMRQENLNPLVRSTVKELVDKTDKTSCGTKTDNRVSPSL